MFALSIFRRQDARSISRRPHAHHRRPMVEGLECRQLLTTFTVTSNLDYNPSNTTLTTSTIDQTLRYAVLQSNESIGSSTNTINIEIGTGVANIALTSPLPPITHPVTIDGTQQPGYTKTPLVVLNGAKAGSSSNGLELEAANITIKGLDIQSFEGYGVLITGSLASGDLLQGNFIGTDSSGTVPMSNGLDGVRIDDGASSNTIGGNTPAARNVISGNLGDGVDIESTTIKNMFVGSIDNVVEGNDIGTDLNGNTSAPNKPALGDQIGVLVDSSNGNTIGGITNGAGNTIAGNIELGVKLTNENAMYPTKSATIGGMNNNNLVAGNVITKNLGNGVMVDYGSDNNTIGGTVTGASNSITFNAYSGVSLSTGANGLPVSSNLVLGNLIGKNTEDGVTVSGSNSNTIGGIAPSSSNMILQNGHNGVQITDSLTDNNTVPNDSTKNTVEGNNILNNVTNGVQIDGSSADNTIGGTSATAGNQIMGNGANGVYLTLFGQGNLIQYDVIESNTSYGVSILNSSSFATFLENDTIEKNLVAGVCLNGNSDTAVSSCTIEFNVDYGILLKNKSTVTPSGGAVSNNGSNPTDNIFHQS